MNIEDPKIRLSYATGVTLANNLMAEGLSPEFIDGDAYAAGFMDALTEGDVKLPYEQAGFVLGEWLQKRKEELKQINAAEGAAFLEENGKRDGVVTLDSGLQYEVMQEGNGDSPAATQQVTTHYHGTHQRAGVRQLCRARSAS